LQQIKQESTQLFKQKKAKESVELLSKWIAKICKKDPKYRQILIQMLTNRSIMNSELGEN